MAKTATIYLFIDEMDYEEDIDGNKIPSMSIAAYSGVTGQKISQAGGIQSKEQAVKVLSLKPSMKGYKNHHPDCEIVVEWKGEKDSKGNKKLFAELMTLANPEPVKEAVD